MRLAIPLKKYFNLEGQSGSYTFAPQVEIPLGTAAMNGPFRRSASLITSLGYETETYWLHLGASVQWAYQPKSVAIGGRATFSQALTVSDLGGTGM